MSGPRRRRRRGPARGCRLACSPASATAAALVHFALWRSPHDVGAPARRAVQAVARRPAERRSRTMRPATEKPGTGKTIRWANVFFWQLSGIAVGASAGFLGVAVAFSVWPVGKWDGLFLVAPIPVLAGAVLGG